MKQPVIIEPMDKALHPAIQHRRRQDAAEDRRVHPARPAPSCWSQDGQEVVRRHAAGQDPARSDAVAATSPAVCRAWPSCSRPAVRATAATVTEIDGIVEFRGTTRGLRRIVVRGEDGVEKEYLIPHGKHVRTYEGERVVAGDRLTEGPINPMDILAIKGVNAVQTYLVNAIQEVYRLQGVKINDKHIEIIVSRMLQKVADPQPGRHPVPRGRTGRRSRASRRPTTRSRARTSNCAQQGRARAGAGHLRAAPAGHHQGEPDAPTPSSARPASRRPPGC